MSDCNRVAALKLVIDNTRAPEAEDDLLKKAVQAYWRAGAEAHPTRKDAAIDILTPLRTGCPRGLAQKAQILANMVETRRSAEQIAGFAASIANDALTVSRTYLDRAM